MRRRQHEHRMDDRSRTKRKTACIIRTEVIVQTKRNLIERIDIDDESVLRNRLQGKMSGEQESEQLEEKYKNRR